MIVYISGPITGIKNSNADAFFKMENELNRIFRNKLYLKIINPIKLGKRVDMYFDEISRIKKTNETPEWKDYMRVCIAELVYCTHVIVLKNYEKSKGVKTELFIAKLLGIPVFFNLKELEQKAKT